MRAGLSLNDLRARVLDEDGTLLDELRFPNEPDGIEEFADKLTTFHDEVKAVVESTGTCGSRSMTDSRNAEST